MRKTFFFKYKHSVLILFCAKRDKHFIHDSKANVETVEQPVFKMPFIYKKKHSNSYVLINADPFIFIIQIRKYAIHANIKLSF